MLASRRTAPPPGIDVSLLYASHWRSMVRLAVLLADDVPTAEDVVQEAFLSLYRHRESIREPGAALAYVRRAVINGARSVVRRKVVSRRSFHLIAADHRPQEDTDLSEITADTQILAFLGQLPRRMREVLVLRYWADLSEAQIADALGISTGTVKSTAHKGIDKLRTLMGGAS